MKRILFLLSVVISLASCSEITTDITSDDIKFQDEDKLLPLMLNINSSTMTKALMEDTSLPNGSSVGITIRDDYGRYTGENYTNIRYSSALSAGVQVWETTSPVLLARETGTLFSYWPHSEDEVDGTMITVSATSDIQTDYMWGLPIAVSKSNRTASITMQHALSAVRIYCNRGSYTGAGQITAIAFGGDCAATAGTLDLTCGTLDDLSGQGTMIAPAITAKTITSSYQKVSDIIVVPTSSTYGKVVVTLDGTDYPIEFNTLDLNPGQITEFYLTANNGELFASDVTVGDWTYGDAEGNEIVVSPKVKITGDLRNIAVHNDVSDDGIVTIYAVSMSNRTCNTTVYPVTFIGDATFSQNLEEETGIRVISIHNVESSVEVKLWGLSISPPSNCYVVSHDGVYSFTPVKGNSSTLVSNIASVEVLWESFGTSVTPNKGDLIKSVSYQNGSVTFQTADIFKEGNAVIAAKDENGTILWSWHIWFTDQPEGQVYYNNAGTMMDRNLGAVSTTPGDAGTIGLLYQWGRKDPFLNNYDFINKMPAKSTIVWPSSVVSSASTGTINYAIAHPTTFITSNAKNIDWYYTGSTSTDNTRWTVSVKAKSVYDPCPSGWRVPDGGSNGVWSKALGSSSYFEDESLNISNNTGLNFSGKFGSASTIWYPSSGYRGISAPTGGWGRFWSASPNDSKAYYLEFDSYSRVYPSMSNSRVYAFAVRCIKE